MIAAVHALLDEAYRGWDSSYVPLAHAGLSETPNLALADVLARSTDAESGPMLNAILAARHNEESDLSDA